MSTEFVIPKNNEENFIEIAEKLGIKKIIFLYEFSENAKNNIEEKLGKIESDVEIDFGFIVNISSMNLASKHSKFLAARSSQNDRHLMESGKIRMIYGFGETFRKDYLHQRASGLNNILCEIAKKNNVALGFSYSSVVRNPDATAIIGRMVQNIMLCRKYRLETAFASFASEPLQLRAPHDVKSFFRLLGAIV